MVRLVRHRQTKGAATDMLITSHHRATSLLYLERPFGAAGVNEPIECRLWSMMNFGCAAGGVIHDAVSMRLERPVSGLGFNRLDPQLHGCHLCKLRYKVD